MQQDKIADTLEQRGKTHGKFSDQATATQAIKAIMASGPSWAAMNPQQREAADMIAHKLGRIAAGDPNFADHWIDIAGYATLIARELPQ